MDCGAAVKYRRLDRCEAMIVGAADHAIITVNSASIPERQRFSLGHEIGHWHHHRGRILFCGTSDIGNPAHRSLNPESQADQFASDLVLPNYMSSSAHRQDEAAVSLRPPAGNQGRVQRQPHGDATKLVEASFPRSSRCVITRRSDGGSGARK